MKTSRAEARYRARVARVVAHIVAHPLSTHRLEDLAALAHFSPWHFHRLYAGVTGESVAMTVRRVRLAHAASLLQEGMLSVTEIALASGYESPQAFSRAFSQFSGQAPSAFQAAMQHLAPDAPEERLAASRPATAVWLIEQPAQQVLALRHRGPAATIPHTHRRLRRLIGELPGTVWLGMCREDAGEPGSGLRYHAAAAPAEALAHAMHPDIERIDIPAGLYACHRLAGPYTRINAAFDALYARWLPASGYEPDDRPALERYLNSPHNAAPAELRTDLLVPVRATPATP